MYGMSVPRHLQPPIAGYAPVQVSSRTTRGLHAGRCCRRNSTSSTKFSNPLPLTSWNRHGGVNGGEIPNYHHTAHDGRSSQPNENIPFLPRQSTRRMQAPAPSNLHVRHRRASEADSTRISWTSQSDPHPPPPTAPPHHHPRERRTSHSARPQCDRRRRYPTPDFFRNKFTNFSKYASSSCIATNFISSRFPVIERDQLKPFIDRILIKTQDRPNVLYGALLLLQRLNVMNPHWQPTDVPHFPCYLFVCAYMIARKFIVDDWVCNRTLHGAMALPIDLQLLNQLERALAKSLDYNLTIHSSLLSSFSKRVKKDFLHFHRRYPRYSWDMVSKTDPRTRSNTFRG